MKKFSYTLALSSALLLSSFVQASHTLGGADDTRAGKVKTTGVANAAQYPPLDNQPPVGRGKGKRVGGAPILSHVQTIPQSPQPAAAGSDAPPATHAQLIAQLTEAEQLGVVPALPPVAIGQAATHQLAVASAVADQTPATGVAAPAPTQSQALQVADQVDQAEEEDPAATTMTGANSSASKTVAVTEPVVDPTSNGVVASVMRKLHRGAFNILVNQEVQQAMFVNMTPHKLHEIISALDIPNLSAGKLIGRNFINKTGNQNSPHFFDGYGVIIDFECGTLELTSKGFGNSDVAITAWKPSEENPLRFLRTLITNQHGNSVMEKGPVKTVQMCGTYPVMDMELKVFPQNTFVKLSVMRVEKEYDEREYARVLQNLRIKRIERSLNPSDSKEQ